MPVAIPTTSQPTCKPIDLLPALLAHNEAAWTEFEQWATPRIRRYCRHLGLGTEDAESAGQQVLMTVYCQLGNFRPADKLGSFRRWLFCLTHNEAAELRRQRQRQPAVLDPTELERWPATEATAEEVHTATGGQAERCRAAATQVRAEFGEICWRAFRLVVDADWTAAQAGAAAGKSASAVRMMKCRMCRRLRELLGE